MKSFCLAFITIEFSGVNGPGGGLANYLNRLSEALKTKGHCVHVVVASDRDETREQNGIWIHHVNAKSMPSWLRAWFARLRLVHAGEALAFSYGAYKALKELYKKEKIDLIQSANYQACGLFSLMFLRVPHVTRISSYRPVCNEAAGLRRDRDARVIEWLEWLVARLSRNIYAPSIALQNMFRDKAGIKNVSVMRTPFFVETVLNDNSVYDKFLCGKKYLLFFGRLQLHKGVHILGRALPYVLERCPDLHAVFTGRDTASILGPSMREYIKSLNPDAGDRIVFLDEQPHDRLYPIISGAKLVVLPSLVDNLPNALLEAMSMGRPVIGTIGASFDEVQKDGKTGFLVPAGDVDALGKKIVEAWNHPGLNDIGEAAREKVKEFSPEHTVGELMRYYEKVMGRGEYLPRSTRRARR